MLWRSTLKRSKAGMVQKVEGQVESLIIDAGGGPSRGLGFSARPEQLTTKRMCVEHIGSSATQHNMGLLTIIRKNRQKEKEMRILFL